MTTQAFHVIEAAKLAEKLAVFIPPYSIWLVTEIVKNDQLGITFSLTANEASAAAQFLVQHGYAVPRLDVDPKRMVITLTDRGRRISEAGSIPNLIDLENKEARQRVNRERIIDLGYKLAPWIAFATFMQGANDLLEIVRNYYSAYFPFLVNYLLPALFLLGVVILLWLTLFRPLNQKIRKKIS